MNLSGRLCCLIRSLLFNFLNTKVEKTVLKSKFRIWFLKFRITNLAVPIYKSAQRRNQRDVNKHFIFILFIYCKPNYYELLFLATII
nr:MAG TPA_asm: hypothetical protein [Microviridae sp.]